MSATDGVSLYVGNLDLKTSAETLGKLFETVGVVKSATISTFRDVSRGYGFVDVVDQETAHNIINTLNKHNVDGKEIVIEMARLPGPRQSGPRPRGGGFRGRGRGGFRGGRGGGFRGEFNNGFNDGFNDGFRGPRGGGGGGRGRGRGGRGRGGRGGPQDGGIYGVSPNAWGGFGSGGGNNFNNAGFSRGFGGNDGGYFDGRSGRGRGGRGRGGIRGGRGRSDRFTQAPRDIPTSSTRIHIHNLPYQLTVEELSAVFSATGKNPQLKDFIIPPNRFRSGINAGFGYVEAVSPDEQKRILAELPSITVKERLCALHAAYEHANAPAPTVV